MLKIVKKQIKNNLDFFVLIHILDDKIVSKEKLE